MHALACCYLHFFSDLLSIFYLDLTFCRTAITIIAKIVRTIPGQPETLDALGYIISLALRPCNSSTPTLCQCHRRFLMVQVDPTLYRLHVRNSRAFCLDYAYLLFSA